jgi:hypothetical protein
MAIEGAFGPRGALVLGMPRSGTTLLRRLLGAHPALHCPPETGLFGALGRVLEEHRFSGGMILGVPAGLAYAGMPEDEFVGRLREFAFGVMDDLTRRAGKGAWVEKTAADVFHLPAIERLLEGHCRYVCLVRHPLDVVCSNKDLAERIQGYLPELHDFVRREHMPYRAFAQAWRVANDALLDLIRRRPNQTMLVRYEDLVRSPELSLAALFAFLGVPADVEAVIADAFATGDSHGLGDWKTYEFKGLRAESIGRHAGLGSWMIREIAGIVNSTMLSMGYEPIESIDTTDVDEHRQAELARLVLSMKLREGGRQS